MSEATSLFVLLAPVHGDQLLLPNRAVAEVVAPDGLQPPPAGAPPWLLGRLPWQGLEIPVLRFEVLNGAEAPAPDRRARVIVVRAFGQGLAAGCYGLLCSGYPHLATLAGETLAAAPLRADDRPGFVLARVQLGDQAPAIPHLEAIESLLAA